MGKLHLMGVHTLHEKVVENSGGFHTQPYLEEVPSWIQAMVHMLGMHDSPMCLNL